jgi:[ribosomal protein S5]-alanine N-acetyltransferase
MNSIVLETPRLWLREMTGDDLDFVATMMAHPEVNHYYERRFTRAESKEWLSRQLDRYRRDGHGLWLVTDRTSGEPVGQVGLCMQAVDGTRHAEVGWLLHRPYWGQGYATEAGAATRDAAFERWAYDHVISLIRPVNVPSQRVAVRIGMTHGRTVRFHGYDHVVFGITKEQSAPPPAVPAPA